MMADAGKSIATGTQARSDPGRVLAMQAPYHADVLIDAPLNILVDIRHSAEPAHPAKEAKKEETRQQKYTCHHDDCPHAVYRHAPLACGCQSPNSKTTARRQKGAAEEILILSNAVLDALVRLRVFPHSTESSREYQDDQTNEKGNSYQQRENPLSPHCHGPFTYLRSPRYSGWMAL
jgi:hypothetical protein